MDDYIVLIILVLISLFVGGVIVAVIRTKLSDFNKCIGCPHAIHCDKGDPNNKCHLEDE